MVSHSKRSVVRCKSVGRSTVDVSWHLVQQQDQSQTSVWSSGPGVEVEVVGGLVFGFRIGLHETGGLVPGFAARCSTVDKVT